MSLPLYKIKPRSVFGVFSFLSSTLFSYSAVASDNEWRVFTELNTVNYSESFAIESILSDIKPGDPFTENGEATFTQTEWVIGAAKDRWELGLFVRFDFLADYEPDAARFIYADATDDVVPNGNYDIFIDVNQVQTEGARLAYEWPVSSTFTLTPRVSGFIARNMIDGVLEGNIMLDDNVVSEGMLTLDYFFTKDQIFLRPSEKNIGHGFSLDLFADWDVSPSIAVQASVFDLFSGIYWRDHTGTIADATTAISRTEDNGLLIVRPTLQGQNLREDYTQKFPTKVNVSGQYNIDDKWLLSQSLYFIGESVLAESEIGLNLGQESYIGANYEWESGGLGFRVRWKGVSLGFAADSFSPTEARYAKLNIGLSQRF